MNPRENETLAAATEMREAQLALWPLARENYAALGSVQRRVFDLAGCAHGVCNPKDKPVEKTTEEKIPCALQYNPARAVSTGASIDKKDISARPCFLCASNRPNVQTAEEILHGWSLLVNPYPIFPLHFTIASDTHRPQGEIPLEMASMAEKLPGFTVFFNGAKAGASAPDHLHCQAVPTFELPLMRYLESHGSTEGWPYKVIYAVITPDVDGMEEYGRLIMDKERLYSPENCNAFMWIGAEGLLRVAIVPRRAHRPRCYSNKPGEGRMISPGAIDMAGVIVVPRKEDFDNMSMVEVGEILRDTVFLAD